MRLPCFVLALATATAAFRVAPAKSPVSTLGASSPQSAPHHLSAAPHAAGLPQQRSGASGDGELITATEAVLLPVAAIIAGSAILAVFTINEMAQAAPQVVQ